VTRLLAQVRFRKAFATWLALYPLLTLTLWVLSEPLALLPLPIRTLLLTLFLVPVLAFGLVPRVRTMLDHFFPLEET
jgi:antibiotic biosynthesis monooxygenase (ABM) superfamily enzyme